MKWKNFKKVLLPSLIFLLILSACKKENQHSDILESGMKQWKILDGRIVFSSIDAYRNLVDKGTDKEKDDFIKLVLSNQDYKPAMTNYSRQHESINQNRLVPIGDSILDDDLDDIISSTFFLCILNSDGIVQIGDYLFNVNIATNRCYAIHSSLVTNNFSNGNYDALYNEDTTNTNIFSFSTDSTVLDLLEEWGFPVTPDQIPFGSEKRCKESGAARRKVDGNEYYAQIPNYPAIRLKIKLAYQKAGLWFGLVSKLEYQHKGVIGWSTNELHTWESFQVLTGTSYYKYKEKCQSEISLNAGWIGSKGGFQFKEKPYEGTRGLNKYDMQYQFQVGGGVATGYVTKTTEIYRIVNGY